MVPGHAEGVEENSRWSSASRDTGVVAKNVAARKPPDPNSSKNPRPGGAPDHHIYRLSFVVFDPELIEDGPVFLLKRPRSMVLLLYRK
jgi:hypothetical protein